MLNNNFCDFATVDNDTVFALVYTNLSHEFSVWLRFSSFGKRFDGLWNKEWQFPKLGDAQGTPR